MERFQTTDLITLVVIELFMFPFSSWARLRETHSKNLSISSVFNFIDKKVFIFSFHKLFFLPSQTLPFTEVELLGPG